jgi:Putative Actinobacterial Holin-X, holin superfamily III
VAKAEALPNEAKELVDLVIAYTKQETVDPLKRLGKTVAFGVAGAVLVGIGSVFLAMSGLRALQTETEFFEDHNVTWAPYFILTLLLGAGALISWLRLGPGKKDDRHGETTGRGK